MKVLITGATGFLGFRVLERLLVHGETDIRCFVRPGSQRAKVEKLLSKYPKAKIEFIVGNLTSPGDAAKAAQGADVVYHVAAAMGGAPADLFLNTVVASKNLLEALVKSPPKKVILISSFGVYGAGHLASGQLLDENSPLEPHPEKRDVYSHAKLRQEYLFWDYAKKYNIPLVVIRPGVIYGPGGNAFSSRVGLNLFGIFLHLGRNNPIPLSYVDNCAEAIVIAGQSDRTAGQAYNVHDDDLPTSKEYLGAYKKYVRKIPSVTVPYPAAVAMSKVVEFYHSYSKGQLPAIFTPYKTACTWKGTTFTNQKLKGLGWRQLVPTSEGMSKTFEYLKEAGK